MIFEHFFIAKGDIFANLLNRLSNKIHICGAIL